MDEELGTIVDLLMGASLADNHIDADELAAVKAELCTVLGLDALPAELEARITEFSPARFDVDAAAALLSGGGMDEKRRVLEMIVAINDSDGELAVEEDEYLRRVARGLGVPEAEIESLVLEVVEIDDD